MTHTVTLLDKRSMILDSCGVSPIKPSASLFLIAEHCWRESYNHVDYGTKNTAFPQLGNFRNLS